MKRIKVDVLETGGSVLTVTGLTASERSRLPQWLNEFLPAGSSVEDIKTAGAQVHITLVAQQSADDSSLVGIVRMVLGQAGLEAEVAPNPYF